MISTIFWKKLLAVQCISPFLVEFKKVFQQQQQISRSQDRVSEASRSKNTFRIITILHYGKVHQKSRYSSAEKNSMNFVE